MFKSVQIKMILIIIALAILMLAIPGYIYIEKIGDLTQNPEYIKHSILFNFDFDPEVPFTQTSNIINTQNLTNFIQPVLEDNLLWNIQYHQDIS